MDRASIFYHDIFDYPLSTQDLKRWKSRVQLSINNLQFTIENKNGYYFVKGRSGLLKKRLLREKISEKKLEIAKKASKILSFIPTTKMVAITGSLAMKNSTKGSDIDLMVITKKGMLWTTRLAVYCLLFAAGTKIRSVKNKNEKDKLCLNIWMDESDLVWKKEDRNVYSAHEIGQIRPLIDKENTYEKLLFKNKWVLNYWPNCAVIKNLKLKIKNSTSKIGILENLCYQIQLRYMKSKLTRETVTPTRAFFHPQDWSKIVLTRLGIEG